MESAVTVRMSAALMELCRIAATADGHTVAAWLRQLAATAVDMKDPEPKPALPRRRVVPKPDPELVMLVRIADQLADLCQWLAAHESQERGQLQSVLDPRTLEDLDVALDRVINRIERLRSR